MSDTLPRFEKISRFYEGKIEGNLGFSGEIFERFFLLKEGLLVYITRKYFLAKVFGANVCCLKALESLKTPQFDRERVSDDWSISMETLQKNLSRFFFSKIKNLGNINQQSFFKSDTHLSRTKLLIFTQFGLSQTSDLSVWSLYRFPLKAVLLNHVKFQRKKHFFSDTFFLQYILQNSHFAWHDLVR